ncbi:MAG: phenylalanine--tRNA ligase subunit beta, partial [Gammaproteobacteria bacterium]
MKVSAQWLGEWVSTGLSNSQLADCLTMAGLEVESVTPVAPPLIGITVAKVIESVPHPNADKLSCCRVDIGGKITVDVVCGARNVRPELVVAYAAPGAKLPDGRTIEHVVIRDMASAGMLCSAAELGLGDDRTGLIEFEQDAQIGTPLDDYLNLRDEIFDIDLTPNRGDCLSIIGIAREAAALTNAPMRDVLVPPVPAVIDDEFPIVIEVPEGCPRYAGRIIRNVDAAVPSPVWIKERLRRSGIRSISAVVDVTNYVMLELGQPLHGFDLDRLTDGIRVRNGRVDETLELLDGETIELNADTLVIADEERAVALAGVMGGGTTGVELNTSHIFLESAYFDAIRLAGVARRYRMHTDASHRFERGVDFTGQERAIERATAMIIEIAGGDPGPLVVTESTESIPKRMPIKFRFGEIERLIGVTMEPKQATEIFESLGCRVTGRDSRLEVIPPDFRFDLELEADLTEEIARMYGYDEISSTLPQASMNLVRGSSRHDRDIKIREVLITQGYYEAITYSFIERTTAELIAPDRRLHELSNPITSEMAVMRTSIWPGLLNAASHNLNRQIEDIRLFELGMLFEQVGDELEQRYVLAGLALGKVRELQWGETQREVDFYDIKQDLENIIKVLGLPQCEWRLRTDPALHPGQSAAIESSGSVIGKLGVLHPKIARHFDLE